MKKIVYLLFALSFAACSSNETKTQQNYSTTPGGLAGLQQPSNQSEQPADSNLKVNPAHGEPGHDCALPVGAPLNTKATPTPPTNAIAEEKPAAASNEAKPKVNPAHGMPGHDCAKPVGAPLS